MKITISLVLSDISNVNLIYDLCIDNISGRILIKINDVQNHITKFSL